MFSAEFSQLVTALAVIILTIGVIVLIVGVIPAIRRTEFAQRYSVLLGVLDQVITDTVLRVAFSPEDLSRFELEAETKGRDVRLQAALYLIDRWTTSLGLDIDEEYIISRVEAKLVELKQAGVIPRADDSD